jgi:hypothetical protein
MLSARRRQWIAPDCRVGRVRNDGDDQPLHHLAVANVSEKMLRGCLHALQAGIDRWRSVSPYFMVREVGEVESWESGGLWNNGCGTKLVLYLATTQVLRVRRAKEPGWCGYLECHWDTGRRKESMPAGRVSP